MRDSMLAPLACCCILALVQFLALYSGRMSTAVMASLSSRWQAQRGAFFVPFVCPLLYPLYGAFNV
jgi:hypothetical protein